MVMISVIISIWRFICDLLKKSLWWFVRILLAYLILLIALIILRLYFGLLEILVENILH